MAITYSIRKVTLLVLLCLLLFVSETDEKTLPAAEDEKGEDSTNNVTFKKDGLKRFTNNVIDNKTEPTSSKTTSDRPFTTTGLNELNSAKNITEVKRINTSVLKEEILSVLPTERDTKPKNLEITTAEGTSELQATIDKSSLNIAGNITVPVDGQQDTIVVKTEPENNGDSQTQNKNYGEIRINQINLTDVRNKSAPQTDSKMQEEHQISLYPNNGKTDIKHQEIVIDKSEFVAKDTQLENKNSERIIRESSNIRSVITEQVTEIHPTGVTPSSSTDALTSGAVTQSLTTTTEAVVNSLGDICQKLKRQRIPLPPMCRKNDLTGWN